MKYLFIVLLLVPTITSSQTLYGVWTDLDGSSVAPGISGENQNERKAPRMALDSKDQPHIIWQEGNNESFKGEIYYLYWNKTEGKWDTFGNADKEGGLTQSGDRASGWESAISVDSKGYPHVVYAAAEQDSFDYRLYYRYWDGEKWTSYGDADKFPEPSVITPARIVYNMSPLLYLDENDFPWIAVTLESDNILFSFWDGEKWRGYGDSNSEAGLDTSPYSSGYGGPLVKELKNVDGYPTILCTSRGFQGNKLVLPVVITWDDTQWLKTDLGEPGFIVEDLKLDSEARYHALGYTKGSFPSRNQAYYALFEDGVWKKIGNDSFVIPYSLDARPEDMTFTLDKNNYPHVAYGGNISGYGELRYTFWDGEIWNGREWSQLDKGIHDSTGKFVYGVEYPKLLLDSMKQPCIVYRKFLDMGKGSICYLWGDLYKKQNSLSIGIISDKPDYKSEDKLKLSLGIVNPEKERSVNLYLVLLNEKTSEFWFFPNWTDEISPIQITLPPDQTINLTEVLNFDIPCDTPPLSYDIQENWYGVYRFIFAAFNSESNEMLDMREIRFQISRPE